MKKPMKMICDIVILLAVAAGGFFAGRVSVGEQPAPLFAQTFYAIVEQIGDGWLLVEGLEVNDINHRSKFTFSIREDTMLVWHYTDLLFEELEVGQNVAVTYTGPVLESYPAQLTNVLRVELLDDSKKLTASPEPEPTPDVVTVVDIIDRTEHEPIVTADVLEGFWSDDEYIYYFGSLKSGLIIVHYSDGTQENVREAMGKSRVTLADLDNYGIKYYKEPKE